MTYHRQQVIDALNAINYSQIAGPNKIQAFLYRCAVESYFDSIFTKSAVENTAFGMLDRDLEKSFFHYLNNPNESHIV